MKRDERRSDEVEEKPKLVEAISDDGRRPFVGGLSFHPSGHVLPTESDVAAHTGEHFFRDWDLENGFEAVVSVDVGTKTSHDCWVLRSKEREEGGNVGNKWKMEIDG